MQIILCAIRQQSHLTVRKPEHSTTAAPTLEGTHDLLLFLSKQYNILISTSSNGPLGVGQVIQTQDTRGTRTKSGGN